MVRNYYWFTDRRKTRALELAHEQIIKALDTVIWLHKATESFSERNLDEANSYIKRLFLTEERVDQLRTETFKELSKGTSLIADYREDLLHLVKRADTLADNTKDAARCLIMLSHAELPKELCDQAVAMTEKLVDITKTLRTCIEKVTSDSAAVICNADIVEKIEHEIDKEYLKTKKLFVKYGLTVNRGAMVILDDLIEFIEQAADMCADTADYIRVLSSRE